MPYFVSRQRYWPDAELRVEIAGGGRDYANPGMLGVKYARLGEGDEYLDPVKAVEAAIAICKQWRKDDRKSARTIMVAHGHTGGMTMPFDGCTFIEARDWALEVRKHLARCPHCDSVMGAERFRHNLSDEPFCSETCSDSDYEFQMKEDGADLEEG